jgi:ABC-type polysaccharide/polyol phosphate transport system ATPase subunit
VSAHAVRLEHVGKRFLVPRTQRTALRALRAIVRGEPLRHELWALEDVSFSLPVGSRIALIGRNGCGKTTLLRLLSGILMPTMGVLEVASKPRALFSTTVGFSAELSVADNVYLFGAIHGMTRSALLPRHEEIIARAGIAHLTHSYLKDLSVGQIQRLGLSVFAETDGRFLIFDEVLGNVDRGFARTTDAFFRSLADSGRTIVMTSHDPAFLRAHCERAIWIDGGRVREDGPFDAVMRGYERSFDGDPCDPAAAPTNGAGPAAEPLGPAAAVAVGGGASGHR